MGEVWRRRWGDRRKVNDLKVVGFSIFVAQNSVGILFQERERPMVRKISLYWKKKEKIIRIVRIKIKCQLIFVPFWVTTAKIFLNFLLIGYILLVFLVFWRFKIFLKK